MRKRLQVRRRGGRKRALGTRAPLTIPSGPNQRWSLDFLSDAFVDGRRFRILAVVDDFTRECLALVADTSLPGLRVVRELEAIVARRGRPAMCVSDNGTELTGMAVLRWCQEIRIEWHYIAPGKPTQNAFIESFNGRCSMRRCSPRSRRLAQCWLHGRTITTTFAHTVRSAISRRANLSIAALADRNGARRCAMPGAPRPAPLLHRAHWAQMSPGLHLLADESWGSGQILMSSPGPSV